MGTAGQLDGARVRVGLPLEWAGGPLSRLVAVVQAQVFARRAARERGEAVGVEVVWGPEPGGERALHVLNRHLLLTRVRVEVGSEGALAALRGQLEQLLPAGPERGRALERCLPRAGEGLRAAAERLWSAWFPGIVFVAAEVAAVKSASAHETPSHGDWLDGTAAQGLAVPSAGPTHRPNSDPESGPVLAEFGWLPGARPLPRVFLISAATARALERLGLPLDAALAAPLAEGERAPPGPPPAVVGELRTLAERLRADLSGLRGALAEVDRGLGVQSRRTAAQAQDLIEALARRAERVHQNRAGTRRRHQRRASNALWPLGRPQIEVLSCLQYAALFGDRLVECLCDGLDPESRAVQALLLESEPPALPPRGGQGEP